MADSKKKQQNFKFEKKDGILNVFLTGDVIISNHKAYNKFDQNLDISETNEIILDCGKVNKYDSYLLLLIKHLDKTASKNSVKFRITGMNEGMESFYKTFAVGTKKAVPQKGELSFFRLFIENIGTNIIKKGKDFYKFIEFLGELILKALNLIIHPKAMRWKDFPTHFTDSGVNAIPITVLIMFLIGIITGYQGALQLKQFGADIYIADLIGVSLSRELTPLMVSILVAGRSGSAYAAELGTMKVSEEIDALQSLGFDKIKFLVLPRVLSVTFAMPLLVIICNLVGIAGGLVAALTSLDITITSYVNQLQMALSFADVFSGLFKSIVFGFMIATVGCFRGLQVSGGAESVGRFTTSSVVSGVFLIILIDALFVFIFQSLGI